MSEPEENERYNPRKFGYTHIFWDIENCFFVTHRKKWEIYSPAFNVSGSCITTWRFILKATKDDDTKNYLVSLHLERLKSDSFTGPVRAFWHVWHSCGSTNVIICENEGIFEGEGRISVRIKNLTLNLLEGWLQTITSEKFRIQADILVNTTEDTKIFQRSKDIGLKTLSQELSALFNLQDYHDLKINIDGMTLLCHKAIVSARSQKLEESIDKHSEKGEIDLDYRSNKSVSKVFRFLYSGNLEHILRMPSISMHEDINYFGIKELEPYYVKNALTLSTKFEGREFCFKWQIMDINSGKENILSTHFGNGNLNITFRIRLELNEECDQSECVDIFLEIVEGSAPEELYIRFDSLDSTGNFVHLSAMPWFSGGGGNLGIKNSIPKKKLSVVSNGELCIICTIFIPTGASDLREDNSALCCLCKLDHEEHYSLLSKQISTLFETGKHSDLVVKCRGERFRVHKCIMSARSYVLATAIRNLYDREHGFLINSCNPNTLRIVLDYIYSGILRNYELSDVLEIYKTAESLCLTILTNLCSEILQDNLQILNVLEALTLANSSKQNKLKISCFKFIMHNSKAICQQQENWKQFKKNLSLYEELKEYARNYIRNNPGILELDEDFQVEIYLERIRRR